ncbi:MAG: LuxR C-terminal-related transcriptional regulator [Phycisphaerales bacterium]
MTMAINRSQTRLPGTETPFFAALAADSSASVLILSDEGVIEFANTGVSKIFGTSSENLVGQVYSRLFEDAGARERLDFAKDVARSGETLTVDGMINGRMIRCTYRVLTISGSRNKVLVTSRTAQTASEMDSRPDGRYVKAKAADSGPLGQLTPREMEIMRLIGLGLSTAAIAKKLHRSVKTIEWHRVSLGTKLGVTNRVELARIAIAAGLVGLDASSENEARAAKAAS